MSDLPYPEGARPRVLIIGFGHSGLCLGIALKKAGIHSFTILEKCERPGGTPWENLLLRAISSSSHDDGSEVQYSPSVKVGAPHL